MQLVGECVHGVAKVGQWGAGNAVRMVIGTDAISNSLHEGREPGDQRERITSVTIGDAVDRVDHSLFVKAEVDPGHEPPKLNKDPGILETKNAQNSGKGEISHGKSLKHFERPRHS